MSESVGLDQWKEQIARSKRLNKKIAEEQAANTKEEVATDEAPEVAPVTDSIEVTVNEPSTEVIESQVEVTTEAPVVETTDDEVVPEVTELINEMSESESTSEVPDSDGIAPSEEVYEAEVEITTDTEPVVEESVDPTSTESTVADNDNSADTISNFGSFESKPLFKHGRIDKSNKKYKGIQQESLRSFCNEALLKGDIPEQIVLQCGIIRKNYKLGIWEEGGAANNRGSVLLVTDQYGKPKEAVTAYNNPNVFNGKHAFIPLNMYDHVILGVSDINTKLIGIYHVSQVVNITKEGGSIVCDRVATIKPRDDEYDDISLTSYLTDYEQEWLCAKDDGTDDAATVLDNVLNIASSTLYDTQVCHPLYIKDYYTEFRLNDKDYWNVLQDTEYLGKLVQYPDIESAYTALDEMFAELFDTTDLSGKDPLAIITLNLTKSANGTERLIVYISGIVYDKATSSSVGSRIYYGAVVLKPECKFYYPDTPETPLSYESIVSSIKKRYTMPDGNYGICVTTLKRMTK
jgi:hypothetical protein